MLLVRFRLLPTSDEGNALVRVGAVQRAMDKPARLAITDTGRKRLNEYRS